MNQAFQDRVRQKIARNLASREAIMQRAEQRRAAGQWGAYWSLSHPRSIGDFYYLAGDLVKAQAEWQTGLQYYTARIQWSESNGNPMPPSPINAGLFVRTGQYQKALPIYRYLAALQDGPAERGMYGIPLIQCGAVEEGRRILHERILVIDKGSQNSLPDLHHLAECWFWIGAYDRAALLSQVAAQHWPTENTKTPIQALDHLIRFAQNGDPAERVAAVRWFEQAAERFFNEDDLIHAVDACEYARITTLWQPGDSPPTGSFLLGISFLHQ